LGIFSLLLKPKAKTAEQKLREVRASLNRQSADTRDAIVKAGDDDQFVIECRDVLAICTAQVALIDELLDGPERYTALGLENLLREKFGVYNELQASLAALPEFDEPESELNYDAMTSTERIQRKVVCQYHERRFMLHHQCDLLSAFLGLSDYRMSDIRRVIGAHYLTKRSVFCGRAWTLPDAIQSSRHG
jgi:hypothetical protein